jgi:hypothetical protein
VDLGLIVGTAGLNSSRYPRFTPIGSGGSWRNFKALACAAEPARAGFSAIQCESSSAVSGSGYASSRAPILACSDTNRSASDVVMGGTDSSSNGGFDLGYRAARRLGDVDRGAVEPPERIVTVTGVVLDAGDDFGVGGARAHTILAGTRAAFHVP